MTSTYARAKQRSLVHDADILRAKAEVWGAVADKLESEEHRAKDEAAAKAKAAHDAMSVAQGRT